MRVFWPEGLFNKFKEDKQILVTSFFDEEYSTAYLSSEKAHIRILVDRIQFAARKTFDRWGNSVDFELYYPRRDFHEEDADAILEYVNHLIDVDDYAHDLGEHREISIRQAKQYHKKHKGQIA